MLGPVFKHKGFNKEEEWRLVYRAFDNKFVHFIPRNKFLTPFINVYIGNENTLDYNCSEDYKSKNLPVRKVWIGPSRLEHLAYIGAYGHLIDHEYYGVEIKPSKLIDRSPGK